MAVWHADWEKDSEGQKTESKENIPEAYKTGVARFCDLDFYVDPSVMIPRAASEAVVESCVSELRSRDTNPSDDRRIKVLDIGAGSGCLLISVLSKLGKGHGVAIDISSAALDVCQKNVTELLPKEDFSVDTVEGSFFEMETFTAALKKIGGIGENPGPFDLVVCNPPYLHEYELNELSRVTLVHEPKEAFCSNGRNPYCSILQNIVYLHNDGTPLLAPGGSLVFEVPKNPGLRKRIKTFASEECAKIGLHMKREFSDRFGLDRGLVFGISSE